jgi:hypothetical protein
MRPRLQIECGAQCDADRHHGVGVSSPGQFADPLFADGADFVQAYYAGQRLGDPDGDQGLGRAVWRSFRRMPRPCLPWTALLGSGSGRLEVLWQTGVAKAAEEDLRVTEDPVGRGRQRA